MHFMLGAVFIALAQKQNQSIQSLYREIKKYIFVLANQFYHNYCCPVMECLLDMIFEMYVLKQQSNIIGFCCS